MRLTRAKFSTVGATWQVFVNHKNRLRQIKELGVQGEAKASREKVLEDNYFVVDGP